MKKYAVLKIKGKQYKAFEGQELLVDKAEESKINADLMLISDGEKVSVGKPLLDSAKIKFKVLKYEEKGEKIDIFKYKSKSRYRKHLGFRPKYTRILIEKIG